MSKSKDKVSPPLSAQRQGPSRSFSIRSLTDEEIGQDRTEDPLIPLSRRRSVRKDIAEIGPQRQSWRQSDLLKALFVIFVVGGVILLVVFLSERWTRKSDGGDAFADLQPWERTVLDGLGSNYFDPSTNSRAARAHFAIGIRSLHVFWYQLAREQFRRARELDPGMLIAYWGEAMTAKHPIWGREDLSQAAEVFEAADHHSKWLKGTEKERDLWHSARILLTPLANDDMVQRDKDYSSFLKSLTMKYPDDLEIWLFFALSKLGLAIDDTENSSEHLSKARSILANIEQNIPTAEHPGLSHYKIHAFDVQNPEVVRKALGAAFLLPSLASAATHALHMPSHLFVRLGWWPETARANQDATIASDRLCSGRGGGVTCDFEDRYHAIEWHHYALLQQGKFQQAQQLLDRMEKDSKAAATTGSPYPFSVWLLAMRARQILQKGILFDRWESRAAPPHTEGRVDRVREYSAEGGSIFAHTMSAIMNRKATKQSLTQACTRLEFLSAQTTENPRISSLIFAQKLQLEAAFLRSKGELDHARTTITLAVEIERKGQVNQGIAEMDLPYVQSLEMWAWFQLWDNQTASAINDFHRLLHLYPKRSSLLLGLARAYHLSGQDELSDMYRSALADIWEDSDQPPPAVHAPL